MVCKLEKAIYSLKQSPQAWFDKFSRIISKGGFQKFILIIGSSFAEYIGMTHATCEMMWLKSLLWELGFSVDGVMSMYYILHTMYSDSQALIYVASNLVFHEKTKHIEMDFHFFRDAVSQRLISILFIPSSEELANLYKTCFS